LNDEQTITLDRLSVELCVGFLAELLRLKGADGECDFEDDDEPQAAHIRLTMDYLQRRIQETE
jgi:hypothetical protein